MIVELKKFINSIINPFPYRMYTRKHQCIFIHVPKAAGTSILHALSGKRIDRDHASYSDYLKASPKKFNQYFKFTFVRNPWDRIVSAYFYLLSGGNQSPADIEFSQLLRNEYNSFDKFVMNYLNDENMKRVATLRTQSSFLCNDNNEIMVDFVGKYEQIDSDFKKILDKIGIENIDRLQQINTKAVERKHYSGYYSDVNVRNKIGSLYSLDIDNFDYVYE
jgi:hypothetical protein